MTLRSHYFLNGYTVSMKSTYFNLSTGLRSATILIWAILFISLLRRDVFIKTIDNRDLQALQQAEAEEYQSIYFKNSKIGYVENNFKKGSELEGLLEQHARMILNVANAVQTIDLHLTATLYAGNLLKNFSFSFHSPFYQMKAKGSVTGNSVSYTLVTGTNTIRDTVTFSTPPLLATSRRAYLLNEGIRAGEKRRLPWFDPVSLTGKESILEYRGKESVLINGRIQILHRFTETFSGTRVNSWLNDSGVVVKEESPAGFIFLKEPKFKAFDLSTTGEEILSAVAVKTKGEYREPSEDTVRYRLTFPDDVSLDLAGDRQQFDNHILTITREKIPEGAGYPACSGIGESLSPSPYVQADNQKIQNLSQQLTENLSEPTDKVRRLALWVFNNLEKRPVLGLPDALTTLENRQGDCNEHAALFAALSRSASIPTRVVAGVTRHKDAFYYHAWNEVCLDSRWISIDTTTNQFPADLGHLRFVRGEIQEQVRIGGLLGRLSIEQLP